MAMAKLVLRVRLIGGDHLDVSVEDAAVETDDELLDRVVATLAQDAGSVRTTHGDRTLVLFGRGVAGFELSPRGAVL
jgi:class 3 adenylate cyclase